MNKKIVITAALMMFLISMFLTQLNFARLPGQQPGPVLDEWHFINVSDPSAMLAALEAGEIHYMNIRSPVLT